MCYDAPAQGISWGCGVLQLPAQWVSWGCGVLQLAAQWVSWGCGVLQLPVLGISWGAGCYNYLHDESLGGVGCCTCTGGLLRVQARSRGAR